MVRLNAGPLLFGQWARAHLGAPIYWGGVRVPLEAPKSYNLVLYDRGAPLGAESVIIHRPSNLIPGNSGGGSRASQHGHHLSSQWFRPAKTSGNRALFHYY